SMKLPLSGCSKECYKEVEIKSCCPGYWGPDCIGQATALSKFTHDVTSCLSLFLIVRVCVCVQEGFAGTACEDCTPGRYSPTCSSVCSCVHGLCASGIVGDGRCTCFSGYTGPNCDQELPECAALSCQQNSRCIEEALTGRLVCQCLPGYQRAGSECLSINPCLQRVCHAQASCVHTGPNQHLCTCNEGYSGDGRVCMAIDPCQTDRGGCSAESARCVYNGPGRSHCECLSGFDTLSGGGCSLKNSCTPDSCHRNANCSTVGPGQVECACLQGYIGNGKVCIGNIMERLNDLNTEPGGQWTGQLRSLSWPLQNLGPFTVFIPINKGFKGTPVRTLIANRSKATYLCKMHLVAGMMQFDTLKKTDVFYTLTGKSAETDTSEGDAQTKIRIHGGRKKGVIIQSNVVASNGIIHIINRLMESVPPIVESNTEVARDFSLGKTPLASLLDQPGPITVLAPTTAAFDAMIEEHLKYLMSPDGHSKLLEFLRNHIIPATSLEIYNAVSTPRYVTMANQVLTITGQILVNGAAVLEAAVEAKNGRLYVMDGVLTPPSIEPVLPSRCDITETKIIMGSSTFGCSYIFTKGNPSVKVPVKGCSAHCNSTVTVHTLVKPGTCPCIHGQCDNRPDSDGRCKVDSCQQGYTGPLCDRQTAACGAQAQFCHAHADCDFSQGTVKCICKTGFQGDGITCVASDPCAPPHRGGCSLNAKCIKTGPGTHVCQCLTGWSEDGDECQPINNCNSPDRGGCHPNATCVYVGPGQVRTLISAETPSVTVSLFNCLCVQASCLLLSSQWTCVCDEGYVGNGHVCYGTVEQVSGGQIQSAGSCLCFQLTLFPGDFRSSVSLVVFVQITSVGGALIGTSNVAATNGLIHFIDKVLVPDRTLSEGLLATLALRPEFSLFRSYLIDYNLTNDIEQADEFTIFAPTDAAVTEYLKKMATTCYHVVASQRLLKTDLQLGGYKETMLGFSFQLGIFPRDGKLFVNDAPMNSSDILSGKGVIHGLSAVLQINRNRCDDLTYTKVMGNCVDCLFHQNKICPNDTIPDKSVRRTRKCMFTRTFEGEWLPRVGCRATCLQKKIERRCCAGFFGEHCEACPGPKGRPCFGNGVCVDGTNGTGVCRCNEGFNGTACETCQSGKYGVHCDQECECKNGQCNEGLKGDGSCECDVDWRGVHCDQSKAECRENCVTGSSGPQCICAAGFKGNGTFCQAIDPCVVDNGGCSLYALCKRTRPGRRDCVCNAGYAGDGLVCVEINPCLKGNGGCHANADCIHVGPNKTSCVCREFYTGDGKNCNIIDLCRKVSLSSLWLVSSCGKDEKHQHMQDCEARVTPISPIVKEEAC
uniref:Stabilin 2 n=1 Tax=Neolamprologus brichardi TaxID=32507 RepID=A0A3Q4I1D9_NEOBR